MAARAENPHGDGALPQTDQATNSSSEYAASLFSTIASGYGESHRRYHTLDHIEHCLAQLDLASDTISTATGDTATPDLIELAIWYHDVIYIPEADDNEERSAVFFQEVASGHLKKSHVDSVYRLIMATLHRAKPSRTDEAFMVDIDLSSFGMPWEDFYRDSVNVRSEMAHLTDAEFAAGHERFLRSLVERDSIYVTGFFRDLYEERARKNIESYLEYL